MIFLQGAPKFEVTPLHDTLSFVCVGQCVCNAVVKWLLNVALTV